MANTDNPLIKALPPEIDYLSYLTILEYNLTLEQLPVLHDILQDETLTANIGWDLVHLLLPLLPASQQCLQDVSRLGNPREVVLKATELLEGIGNEEHTGEDEDGDLREEDGEADTIVKKLEELGRDDITVHVDGEKKKEAPENVKQDSKPPSKYLRFTALLQMLSILHPRIKTKYPSRFLSTSLQAVLPAFMQVAQNPDATESVLGFIKDLSGTQRPRLPPRKSSSAIPAQEGPRSAPDPEGQDEVIGVDEVKLQSRLLQSFLTYVTEGYMTSLVAEDDVPGLAWSSRYHERMHPKKVIPGRKSHSSLFAEEESLHQRDATMGHILALVRDLKISADELLEVITRPDDAEADETEELPSAASDVPLSRTGSMYLLSTMAASSAFFDAPASLPPLRLIPDFAAMLGSSLGDSATGSMGAEPEPLIDAVLFLGFLILNNVESSIPSDDDEVHNNILQRLSLLSASLPSPTLRYNAHLLTASILHSHPEDHFRLAFIRDTLEHCPFENLKASAVGWLKEEVLDAERSRQKKQQDLKPSIFASSAVMEALSPFLFPSADTLIEGQAPSDAFASFQAYQHLSLAILNLLYLFLSSQTLSENLGLAASAKADPQYLNSFLKPLIDASRNFRTAILSDDIGFGDDQEGKDAALGGLELLDMSVQEVEDALSRIRHG